MKDDNIPLLDDLISAGHQHDELAGQTLGEDENQALEISADEATPTQTADDHADTRPIDDHDDDIKDDANLKELIIDEEIRMILDRHMDNAYDEIIRLLNRRIC